MRREVKDWALIIAGGLVLFVGLCMLCATVRGSARPLKKIKRQQKDVAALTELKERGADARDSRIKSLLSTVTVVSEIRPLVEAELGEDAKVLPQADQAPEAGWVLRKVRIDWSGNDWKDIMNFMVKAENEMRPPWKIVEIDLHTESQQGGRAQLMLQQLYSTGGTHAH